MAVGSFREQAPLKSESKWRTYRWNRACLHEVIALSNLF